MLLYLVWCEGIFIYFLGSLIIGSLFKFDVGVEKRIVFVIEFFVKMIDLLDNEIFWFVV